MAPKDSERLYTSHEVGSMLQVDPTSVVNWVDQGRIAAFKTPGGHRRIRATDLVDFLRQHSMPVPSELDGIGCKRLLVVDDDASQLSALRRLLKPHARRVEVALADNGIDALVMVGSFKPNLVVLDVFMPGLDGFEVCRRLKASPETRGIDIIVTSGQRDPELAPRARAAGALDFMPKPIDVSVVLRTLGIERQPAR